MNDVHIPAWSSHRKFIADSAASKVGPRYPLTGGRQPIDIAVSGDGTIWFTEQKANTIGWITRP